MSHYQDRIDVERLACQAPEVQAVAKEIRDAMHNLARYLYWSLDPEEDAKSLAYNVTSLIDSAHALVDLGHAWRAALAANPPQDAAGDAA